MSGPNRAPVFALLLDGLITAAFVAVGHTLYEWLKDVGLVPSPMVVGLATAGAATLAIVLRRSRALQRVIQQLWTPASRPQDDQLSLFRGPLPYTGEERESFHGRTQELASFLVTLRRSSFVVLDGATGCGKSSFLCAAVLPALSPSLNVSYASLAEPRFSEGLLELIDGPTGLALESIQDPIAPLLLLMTPSGQHIAGRTRAVCIDHFEVLFGPDHIRLAHALLSLIVRAIATGPIHVLVVSRSEALPALYEVATAVDPSGDSLTIGARFKLYGLTEAQTILVLERLLGPFTDRERDQQTVATEFARALTTELLRNMEDLRAPGGTSYQVLPIELQLVGAVLQSLGPTGLSQQWLRRFGGRSGLLRAYIDVTLTGVSREVRVDSRTTIRIIEGLVDSKGARVARSAAELARALGEAPQLVRAVLESLTARHMVRHVPSPRISSDAPLFALSHDYVGYLLGQTHHAELERYRSAREELTRYLTLSREAAADDSSRGIARFWRRSRLHVRLDRTAYLWRYRASAAETHLLTETWSHAAIRLCLCLGMLACGLGVWTFVLRTDAYSLGAATRQSVVLAARQSEASGDLWNSGWLQTVAQLNKPELVDQCAARIRSAPIRAGLYVAASEEFWRVNDDSTARRFYARLRQVLAGMPAEGWDQSLHGPSPIHVAYLAAVMQDTSLHLPPDEWREQGQHILFQRGRAALDVDSLELAVRVARTIDDGYLRGELLFEVAQMYVLKGRCGDARGLALEAAWCDTAVVSLNRGLLRGRAARLLQECGHSWKQASLPPPVANDPHTEVSERIGFMRWLLRLHERRQASVLFQKTVEAVRQMKDVQVRVSSIRALEEMADTLDAWKILVAAMGPEERLVAAEVYERLTIQEYVSHKDVGRAIEWARGAEGTIARSDRLLAVTDALERRGRHTEAVVALKLALACSFQIDDVGRRMGALGACGVQFAHMGQWGEALTLSSKCDDYGRLIVCVAIMRSAGRLDEADGP